jgi:hypothetical protein
MNWILTKDILAETGGGKSRVGFGTYASDKDAATRGLMLQSSLLKHELPHEFRLKDDDGEIYYEGRSDDNTSEDAFEPLDWANAGSGCTSIEYLNDGEWEIL